MFPAKKARLATTEQVVNNSSETESNGQELELLDGGPKGNEVDLLKHTKFVGNKQELLESRNKYIGPCCSLFYADDPLVVVRGCGQYLFDELGQRYLDCVSNVQHAEENLENPEMLSEMSRKYADEVRSAIDRLEKNGRKIAAFYMEALISCGGQIIPPPEYLKNAIRYVHEAGGVVVVDEIQSGFGRVGKNFWAFQLQGKEISPDIVTMGKPMGNGFPVSAVATSTEIAAHFGKGMQYFNTFGGNPVACAAVLAVIDVLKSENLQEKALTVGEYLMGKLQTLKSSHKCIGNVRGVGMFAGIELIDEENTESRSPASELANKVILDLRRKHRILLSAEGPDGNILKFKPPLCFTTENVDEVSPIM